MSRNRVLDEFSWKRAGQESALRARLIKLPHYESITQYKPQPHLNFDQLWTLHQQIADAQAKFKRDLDAD